MASRSAPSHGAKISSVNGSCTSALPISFGVTQGAVDADPSFSGEASCDGSQVNGDLWYRYTPSADGPIGVYFAGEPDFNFLNVSIHGGCPGTSQNEISCNHNQLIFNGKAGEEVLIRVAGEAGYGFGLALGPPARVSGRILEQGSSTPAFPASVRLASPENFSILDTAVDENGEFSVSLAKPGTYFARAGGPAYHPALFDDIDCPVGEACDVSRGTPIPVVAGSSIDGIDIGLELKGRISGTVLDAHSGEPVAFTAVNIDFLDFNGGVTTSTNASGHYSEGSLPPENYVVSVTHPEYQGQLFDNVPCDLSSCNKRDGTPIEVSLNSHREGVDFSLDQLSRISGRVTRSTTGQGLPFIEIIARGIDGGPRKMAITDSQGEYTIGGLPPGAYRVYTDFRGLNDYFEELYQDVPCPNLDCDFETATPVVLGPQEAVTGIDFDLDPGAQIAGFVGEGDAGSPVRFTTVGLYDTFGQLLRTTRTNSSGLFRFRGRRAGTYLLAVTSRVHFFQVFGGDQCASAEDCDIRSGTPITITDTSTVEGIDINLDRLGVIEGAVLDQRSGQPVVDGVVSAFDTEGNRVFAIRLNEVGRYRISGLEPGKYTVVAESPLHRIDAYPGVPFPPCTLICDPTVGARISVDRNQVVSGIDFELRSLASISGKVQSTSGHPASIRLRLLQPDGFTRLEESDAAGNYQFSGLQPGTYFLSTLGEPDGYFDEAFGGLPCDSDCDPSTGTAIPVGSGQRVEGIDFSLDREGAISGVVRDSLGMEPLEATLVLHDLQGDVVRIVQTFSGGSYALPRLAPGTYFLTASKPGFGTQRYPLLPCPSGRCATDLGEAIQVGMNIEAVDIDFSLEFRQGVMGTVIEDATQVPLPGIRIQAYDAAGLVTTVRTSPSGRYHLALEQGTYFLKAQIPAGSFSSLRDQIYDGIKCLPNDTCDPSSGDPISILDDQVVQDIDFALTGQFCTPSGVHLCLNQDRFRVGLTFRDLQGNLRHPMAQPLTEDTGVFTFFDEDNIEVVVKVLDACVDPFQHFWVFAAGLTNLEVTMEVTDFLTGEFNTYDNEAGTPFELISDTSAFATCPGSRGTLDDLPLSIDPRKESVATLLSQIEASVADFEPTLATATEAEKQAALDNGPADCTPSDTVLCLQQGRFRVEALWADGSSDGSGQALPLSPDTGYFWFFESTNVEVIVKVLDACSADDFNSFWVFAAGLTDVEVQLKVTDTVSGVEKMYSNPLGRSFIPVQDTSAFLTCPSP